MEIEVMLQGMVGDNKWNDHELSPLQRRPKGASSSFCYC